MSLVLLNHFWPAGAVGGLLDHAKDVGWLGVDLFFVLSGALITGILLQTKEDARFFRNFYARRALRIFPLYYAFLTVCFIVIPLGQPGPFWSTPFMREAGSPAWYYLYLTNFKLAVTGLDAPVILRVLWSLAIEEHFYLLFPLAVWLLDRRRLFWALIGVLLFSNAIRLWLLLFRPEAHEFPYLLTPARMDTIAFGCLLTLSLRSSVKLPSARWWVLAGMATFGLLGALTAFSRKDPLLRTIGYSGIAAGFALLLGWVLLQRDAWTTGWLRLRPLRYLGTISYGVYILHIFVGAAASRVLDPTLGAGWPVTRSVLKVALTIVAASLSWRWFERPFLNLKRHFDSSRHPLPEGGR